MVKINTVNRYTLKGNILNARAWQIRDETVACGALAAAQVSEPDATEKGGTNKWTGTLKLLRAGFYVNENRYENDELYPKGSS